MPGLQASLYVGLSGLQAQQAALDLVGHNIANVNTPGYSRQRAVLSAREASVEGDLRFGSGVDLTAIQSVRDRFLDLQIHRETGKQSGAEARSATLAAVSSVLGDSGDSGLAAQLQAFFQGFQDLAAQPESGGLRTSLLGKAQTLVTTLQSQYQTLVDQRGQANQEVASLTQQVNALAARIADLNDRVTASTSSGGDSEAEDQRKALTDQLAALVGLQVSVGAQGDYQVTLDGGSGVLVSGGHAFTLTTTPGDASQDAMLQVQVDLGGAPLNVTGQIREGRLGAALDLRDRSLVGLQAQLDQLAAGLAGSVNTLHRAGVALDGATTGLDFFQGSAANAADGLPVGISAQSAQRTGAGWTDRYRGMVDQLRVNAALVANPALIAAAGSAGATGDNTQALALASLATDASAVDAGGAPQGFTDAVSGMLSDLGTQTQGWQSQRDAEQSLLTALQTQRDSLSGVNLDEEAAQLMALQRGYQASARFISVIDQLTAQLMNQFSN